MRAERGLCGVIFARDGNGDLPLLSVAGRNEDNIVKCFAIAEIGEARCGCQSVNPSILTAVLADIDAPKTACSLWRACEFGIEACAWICGIGDREIIRGGRLVLSQINGAGKTAGIADVCGGLHEGDGRRRATCQRCKVNDAIAIAIQCLEVFEAAQKADNGPVIRGSGAGRAQRKVIDPVIIYIADAGPGWVIALQAKVEAGQPVALAQCQGAQIERAAAQAAAKNQIPLCVACAVGAEDQQIILIIAGDIAQSCCHQPGAPACQAPTDREAICAKVAEINTGGKAARGFTVDDIDLTGICRAGVMLRGADKQIRDAIAIEVARRGDECAGLIRCIDAGQREAVGAV